MTQSKDTILVVDDEPESLRLLMGILADEGYRVRPADSGELALASVAAEPPELILLDIRMWGMHGFEICRRIKACEQCQEIPLMFISAATDVEERVKGLALGAVDFISKPFRREELIARVRTHLELGRLRAQLEMQVAKQTAELRAAVEQLQLEVAERQRTEIALRESEERFRNMADTAPVMIWVSGPDKLCTFLNKGWLDLAARLGPTQDIVEHMVEICCVLGLKHNFESTGWFDFVKHYVARSPQGRLLCCHNHQSSLSSPP